MWVDGWWFAFYKFCIWHLACVRAVNVCDWVIVLLNACWAKTKFRRENTRICNREKNGVHYMDEGGNRRVVHTHCHRHPKTDFIDETTNALRIHRWKFQFNYKLDSMPNTQPFFGTHLCHSEAEARNTQRIVNVCVICATHIFDMTMALHMKCTSHIQPVPTKQKRIFAVGFLFRWNFGKNHSFINSNWIFCACVWINNKFIFLCTFSLPLPYNRYNIEFTNFTLEHHQTTTTTTASTEWNGKLNGFSCVEYSVWNGEQQKISGWNRTTHSIRHHQAANGQQTPILSFRCWKLIIIKIQSSTNILIDP